MNSIYQYKCIKITENDLFLIYKQKQFSSLLIGIFVPIFDVLDCVGAGTAGGKFFFLGSLLFRVLVACFTGAGTGTGAGAERTGGGTG